jgi:hypothetical protein
VIKKLANSETARILHKKATLMKLIPNIVILIIAFKIFGVLGRYAESFSYPAQGDFFHDLIPLMPLNPLVSYGYPLILLLLSLYFVLGEPAYLNSFVFMVAILIIVRSLFFSMTHLGAPAVRIDDFTEIGTMKTLNFTKDLFFSGHLAVPFLGFLIVKNKTARVLCLLASALMGFGVLAMHTHYSIDVFAAPFVTFGLFWLTNKYLGRYLKTDGRT